MAEEIVRELVDGEWVTRLGTGGGGGSAFNGGTITDPLIVMPEDDLASSFEARSANGTSLVEADAAVVTLRTAAGGQFLQGASGSGDVAINPANEGGSVKIRSFDSGETLIEIDDSDHVGFFGVAPVARPAGVAVDAAAIHAALVSLGLIEA